MPDTEKKVITTENLKVVTDEMKTNYAKKTYVDEAVKTATGANFTYATDEEVAALLADDPAPEEGGEEPGGEGEGAT